LAAKVPTGPQVHRNPSVRNWIKLELLDGQALPADAGRPVNAVDAIAADVVAQAGGVRRDVVGAPIQCFSAGEKRSRQRKARQLERQRIDQQRVHAADAPPELINAERIAAGDDQRSEGIAPALGAHGAHAPPSPLMAAEQAHHAAGRVPRQGREVMHLHPKLREAAEVSELEFLL
jgi:hypothetical protein